MRRSFAKVCLHWFRFASQDRWEAFAALLELLEFWRIRRSFIREELEGCPDISTPERRALIEKLKKMEPPREDKEPEVNHGGAPGAHGPGPAVAGNNAPAAYPGGPIGAQVAGYLRSVMVFLIILGALAGLVIPLVFSFRLRKHHHSLSNALLPLTFLGYLPLGGALAGFGVGFVLLTVWYVICTTCLK